jgi:hypothetical protein
MLPFMTSRIQHHRFRLLCTAAVWVAAASVALAQGDDRFVGVWIGQGWVNTVELLLRSDGQYQVEARTVGSEFDPMVDRGRYEVAGQTLRMTSYRYLDKPAEAIYGFELDGDSLSLTGGPDLAVPSLALEYELRPGSREDVLARQQASQDLVRRWTRHVLFTGDEEWTFRPGGYYALKAISENVAGFVQIERGRYELTGTHLTLRPYTLAASNYEIDIFGRTLTLISTNDWSGQFDQYTEVPGSAAEVAAKAADAQAFLSKPHWQAGVWQIQDENNTIDLLLRSDGVFAATNATKTVHRVFRGRYTLDGDVIHLVPFAGQERWTIDANFGAAERTYTLDYYDAELKIIDLTVSFTQSVRLGRQSPGSYAAVLELVRQAQAERDRSDWYIGIWEANDPAAWMEFTFRPDHRYIAKSGAAGVARQVERGQYVVAPGKITLAPYAGNGPARGFELDLYDGDLSLIGDAERLVKVRKIPGSDTGVIAKTRDPAALKGERGSILGLWTANRPGENVELVFRPDGEFRLKACTPASTNNIAKYDYGLYSVDMAARTLVYDSRFGEVHTRQLDFYGDTMTLYGGLTNSTPVTYTVNLGSADTAIAASIAADAAEAQLDAQWLVRVPIGPVNPNPSSVVGVPADPNPGQVLQEPTVFTEYQYYRRLIPRPFYGTAVVDTQQWHFFPNGRVLVRFTTWTLEWDMAVERVMDAWGAYAIGPKPGSADILHLYADNDVALILDVGDLEKLTLEDGRRSLFWGKEYYPNMAWVIEQKPLLCQMPGNSDASLLNTGLSLSTGIAPDPIGGQHPLTLTISGPGPVAGAFSVTGATETAASLVLERSASLAPPIVWEALRTNTVPAGPFSFPISETTKAAAFFRVRRRSSRR